MRNNYGLWKRSAVLLILCERLHSSFLSGSRQVFVVNRRRHQHVRGSLCWLRRRKQRSVARLSSVVIPAGCDCEQATQKAQRATDRNRWLARSILGYETPSVTLFEEPTTRPFHQSLRRQDSIAIAKKTARCAQYMGALKSFESPHSAPGYCSRNF